MLIDTHAHLNDERLYPQVDDIADSMQEDGLSAIVNVGYDLTSSKLSVELSHKYENIYAVVGIHPHDAKYAEREAYDYFINAVKEEKTLAIGEIGLDYYYDRSPRDVQQRVFLEQLELADSLNMPVVIHLRDAYEDMYNLLLDNRNKLNNGIVMHCYSGSSEMVEKFLKFDPYYSFGGAITFAKNKERVIKSIKKDRLLTETDCPYMTPVPMR